MGTVDTRAFDAAQHDRASWYAATAAPRPVCPALTGDARAEVVIVGAGFAGLSAALHLAQAGVDVLVVEAQRIGWGASGRNGGQLWHGPRMDIRDVEALVGPDDARHVWAISSEANALVRDLIARHAIACDLRDGLLEAAYRPREAAAMARYADHVAQRYGYDGMQPLDQAQMRARVDSPRYCGGLADARGGHLHPLNYALGLARAAQVAGARIVEQTPVRALRPDGVITAAGVVRADLTIVAANGYLRRLHGGAAARTMPINSYVIATAPLAADALIPHGECVADSKFVVNYFRKTPDNRLLFGGGEGYTSRFPRDIAALVRRPMTAVFPQLRDVRIDHAWGGSIAITRHRAPMFFRPDPRTLVIGGWSGSGVHMATMGGMIAAEAARGRMARWDVLARVPCPGFPGGATMRPALLALAMTWFALRDRL